MVVPHAGTWIEIKVLSTLESSLLVVPHAGTWIEIAGWICDGNAI